MLEIKVTAKELAEAINNLAAAISGKTVTEKETLPETEREKAPEPVNATPAPVSVVPAPTAAPQYTLEQIATAGSALIDAGKLNQLMELLGKYGVNSLTNLKPENYGAVAMDLRAMGARI